MVPRESHALLGKPSEQRDCIAFSARHRFYASVSAGVGMLYLVAFLGGYYLQVHGERLGDGTAFTGITKDEHGEILDSYTYMDNDNFSMPLPSYVAIVRPVYGTVLVYASLSLMSSLALTVSGLVLQSRFGEARTLLHFVTMNAACDAVFHLNQIVVAAEFLEGNYAWLNYLNFFPESHPQSHPTPECLWAALIGTFFCLASCSWDAATVMYLWALVWDAEHGGSLLREHGRRLTYASHVYTWGLSLAVCLVASLSGSYRSDLSFADGSPMWQWDGLSYNWGGAFQSSCSLTGAYAWLLYAPVIAYSGLALLVLSYVLYAVRWKLGGLEHASSSEAAEDALIYRLITFAIFFVALWLCPTINALSFMKPFHSALRELPHWFRYACSIFNSATGVVNAGIWMGVYAGNWKLLVKRDTEARAAQAAWDRESVTQSAASIRYSHSTS